MNTEQARQLEQPPHQQGLRKKHALRATRNPSTRPFSHPMGTGLTGTGHDAGAELVDSQTVSGVQLVTSLACFDEVCEVFDVADLSRCSVKLRMKAELPLRTAVKVRLPAFNGEAAEDRAGVVAWSRCVGHGHWWVGVQFDAPQHLDWLRRFARQSGLDQRLHDREGVLEPVTITLDGARVVIPACLTNLSPAGFLFTTECDLGADARLTLQLADVERFGTVQAAGRIVWTRDVEGAFQTGGEFMTVEGGEAIHQALGIDRTPPKPSLPKQFGILASILVSVALAEAAVLLLRH